MSTVFTIPSGPRSIEKGSTLKILLDREAIQCLASNLAQVSPRFDSQAFQKDCQKGLAPLPIMARGVHLARILRKHLPPVYKEAVDCLLNTLTPPLTRTDDFGLGVFFYLPHTSFVALFGLDFSGNKNRDPFEISMKAQYELTKRFTAEYSIRSFLIHETERTLNRLKEWVSDPSPHVRRLCTEGTRPRLPWGLRLQSFVKDPRPAFSILEALKDDPDLYVRRSVANHLGDIAKDHPEWMYEKVEKWLKGADENRLWLIRHALRHPAKKGVTRAIQLRKKANL